jgi:hypothetical protein
MEHKETELTLSRRFGGVQRFLVFDFELLFSVFLMFAEEFGMEADIAWFVDAVDISESSSDREVRTNLREIAIYIPNIFRLSIQRGIIDSSIVHTYN